MRNCDGRCLSINECTERSINHREEEPIKMIIVRIVIITFIALLRWEAGGQLTVVAGSRIQAEINHSFYGHTTRWPGLARWQLN